MSDGWEPLFYGTKGRALPVANLGGKKEEMRFLQGLKNELMIDGAELICDRSEERRVGKECPV